MTMANEDDVIQNMRIVGMGQGYFFINHIRLHQVIGVTVTVKYWTVLDCKALEMNELIEDVDINLDGTR